MASQLSSFEEAQERPSYPGGSRPARAARLRLRSLLIGAGAVVLLAGAGLVGEYWWTTGRFLISTDDAYVQADSVIISPKVSGYISNVLVTDNEQVHAGQVLARIDDSDYRTSLAAAQADVAAQARRASPTSRSRSMSSSFW